MISLGCGTQIQEEYAQTGEGGLIGNSVGEEEVGIYKGYKGLEKKSHDFIVKEPESYQVACMFCKSTSESLEEA